MYDILLFAGTSEGRRIAESLGRAGVNAWVFVATEYGESLIGQEECLHIESGRLNEAQMEEKILEHGTDAVVVDATHPYAAEVTANIRKACENTGRKYIRVLRESRMTGAAKPVFVESPQKAAEYLSNHEEGNILLTTGSKELGAFTAIPGYQERAYARVLSLPSVVESCAALGFQGSHLICMQGPFSYEMNCALIRQTNAKYLVTKDTGVTGGFPEKEKAAADCGCQLLVIGRPVEETGISVEECLGMFGVKLPEAEKKETEIALIGIGMGGKEGNTMTCEAAAYCRDADLLIGARRMVEAVPGSAADVFIEYKAEAIAAYLASHPEYKKAAILLSGDVGFFSGAKKLLEVLPDTVKVMPGISSMVYFCGKLHTSWNDAVIASNHGMKTNLIGLADKNQKVFSILGKPDDVRNLALKLQYYGMDQVRMSVGENLDNEGERITCGVPADFAEFENDPLCVVLLENDSPDLVRTPGIPDEAFLRDKVPMTKEEVREISLCKLRLTEDAVIYDVGAGSGSVSVEMARIAVKGTVYAVEKNPTAVQLLGENKQKFRVDNMEIIEGLAPEAMAELPAPTHVFVGGSSGNLKEILLQAIEKNPKVRVVVNAITLETIGEALEVMKELPFEDVDIASVTTAKSKELGRYHLMMGQNPVYIISATGRA